MFAAGLNLWHDDFSTWARAGLDLLVEGAAKSLRSTVTDCHITPGGGRRDDPTGEPGTDKGEEMNCGRMFSGIGDPGRTVHPRRTAEFGRQIEVASERPMGDSLAIKANRTTTFGGTRRQVTTSFGRPQTYRHQGFAAWAVPGHQPEDTADERLMAIGDQHKARVTIASERCNPGSPGEKGSETTTKNDNMQSRQYSPNFWWRRFHRFSESLARSRSVRRAMASFAGCWTDPP